MLYIKLITKLDKKTKIEADSDCPEHNGTDINHPVSVPSRHFIVRPSPESEVVLE